MLRFDYLKMEITDKINDIAAKTVPIAVHKRALSIFVLERHLNARM